MKNCKYCSKEIICADSYELKKRKFCSKLCYNKSMIGVMPKKPVVPKQKVFISCKWCKTEFKRKRSSTIFCSMKCRGLDTVETHKEKRACKLCGKDFLIRRCNVNKMCSQECIKKFHTGANSPSWKGGIKKDNDKRKSIECVNWKKQVLLRDNFKCLNCSEHKNLVPHHIFFYSQFKEYRSDIRNGVTLCKECHKLAHNVFKRNYFSTNNNILLQDDTIEWFLTKLTIHDK